MAYPPSNAEASCGLSQPLIMSPLPENRLVVGCGFLSLDFLATVAAYPTPDEKIRSTGLKVQGGGNVGNASTCAARLGLKPKLISKVANDPEGRRILEELESDGVDTSLIVHSYSNLSNDTKSCIAHGKKLFILITGSDCEALHINNGLRRKTRTCIITPGFPPMVPHDMSRSHLLSALSGARIAFFDGKVHKTALIVAEEAHRMGIPLLIDAERKKKGLDALLNLSTYVVCAAKFPQEWTEAPTIPSALVSMLARLPNLKFVIVTLGEDGCIMLERSSIESSRPEDMDVDHTLESLNQRRDYNITSPACVSSDVTRFRANGVGAVIGRLFVGIAEKIPAIEVVDTTGAGDAFVGAILYAICANMMPEQMLPFAAQVAAACCRALGARTGLPYLTDRRLVPYLQKII